MFFYVWWKQIWLFPKTVTEESEASISSCGTKEVIWGLQQAPSQLHQLSSSVNIDSTSRPTIPLCFLST